MDFGCEFFCLGLIRVLCAKIRGKVVHAKDCLVIDKEMCIILGTVDIM